MTVEIMTKDGIILQRANVKAIWPSVDGKIIYVQFLDTRIDEEFEESSIFTCLFPG